MACYCLPPCITLVVSTVMLTFASVQSLHWIISDLHPRDWKSSIFQLTMSSIAGSCTLMPNLEVGLMGSLSLSLSLSFSLTQVTVYYGCYIPVSCLLHRKIGGQLEAARRKRLEHHCMHSSFRGAAVHSLSFLNSYCTRWFSSTTFLSIRSI